jgi:hypothetical protein
MFDSDHVDLRRVTRPDRGERYPKDSEKRLSLRRELATMYEAGDSVRAICKATGRSYGFVHKLLVESGVDFRPRGGKVNAGLFANPQTSKEARS